MIGNVGTGEEVPGDPGKAWWEGGTGRNFSNLDRRSRAWIEV